VVVAALAATTEAGTNRTKLQNLIHRIFDSARLDIKIKDRFGQPVIPREWYLVPLFVIEEAVERIKDGTITGLIGGGAASSKKRWRGGGYLSNRRGARARRRWLVHRFPDTDPILAMREDSVFRHGM
jgi:hypothetical protein